MRRVNPSRKMTKCAFQKERHAIWLFSRDLKKAKARLNMNDKLYRRAPWPHEIPKAMQFANPSAFLNIYFAEKSKQRLNIGQMSAGHTVDKNSLEKSNEEYKYYKILYVVILGTNYQNFYPIVNSQAISSIAVTSAFRAPTSSCRSLLQPIRQPVLTKHKCWAFTTNENKRVSFSRNK